MNDSVLIASLRFFWKDILGDIVAFPLWWYTRGTLWVIQFIIRQASNYAQTLSLKIWVKNLFVPMYSQYDIAGRLISFFLRIVVLIYRVVLFIIWLFLLLAFLGLWMFGPFLVLYVILYQLFGVTFGV